MFPKRYPCTAHLSCLSLHTATMTSRLPRIAISITTERKVSSTTFSTDPNPSLELEVMGTQSTKMWRSSRDAAKAIHLFTSIFRMVASPPISTSNMYHAAKLTNKGFPRWGLGRWLACLGCLVLFVLFSYLFLPCRDSSCLVLRYLLVDFCFTYLPHLQCKCTRTSVVSFVGGVRCIILAHQLKERVWNQGLHEHRGCCLYIPF